MKNLLIILFLISGNCFAQQSVTVNASSATPIQYFSETCGYNSAFTFASATTYYYGAIRRVDAPTTSAGARTFPVPVNCTLIGYSITTVSNGAVGSGESATVSVRINNTTDVLLSNAVTYNNAGGGLTPKYFYSMALNTNLNAGDFYEIKELTPTFSTIPTGTTTVTLYFKSR